MTTFTFDHIHLLLPTPEPTATYFEKMFDAEIVRSTPNGQPHIDLKLDDANVFVAPVSDADSAALWHAQACGLTGLRRVEAPCEIVIIHRDDVEMVLPRTEATARRTALLFA